MAFASASSSAKRVTNGRPFRGRSLSAQVNIIGGQPIPIPPLATWRENARFISSTPSAIRFAFLCAYSRHSGLRQLGLQLVGSLRFPLTSPLVGAMAATTPAPPKPLHLNTFMGLELISVRFLVRCLLQSADRCDLISGR